MGDVIQQRTLKNSVGCRGTGLHTGAKVAMTLRPGKPGSGIVFKRTDVSGARAVVAAHIDNVTESRLCTTLKNGGDITVSTVEHLMAALAGCGIDNAEIEINGPEVPIMDGSAAPFVFLIECAGIVEQAALRRMIMVRKRVSVEEGGNQASLTPGRGFSVGFEIDFPSPAVRQQEFFIDLVDGAFKAELSRARTFGFAHDVAKMRSAGLIRGGSLDNAIVVSGEGVLNQDGLRYADEFVRHKVLDCIGDLYLAGAPLIGHFRGARSGHKLNHRLLRALFADSQAWSYVTLGAGAEPEARPAGEPQDETGVPPPSVAASA